MIPVLHCLMSVLRAVFWPVVVFVLPASFVGAVLHRRGRSFVILWKASVAVFVGFILTLAAVDRLLTWRCWVRFESLNVDGLAGMTISTQGRTVFLRPEESHRVLQWIVQAPSVGAHHSHPVDVVELSFVGEPRLRYKLGRDSTVAHEFHLLDLSDRGDRDPVVIKQFRSRQLSEFLSSGLSGTTAPASGPGESQGRG